MEKNIEIKAVENHDGSQVVYLYAEGHVDLALFRLQVAEFRAAVDPGLLAPAFANADLEGGCHAWLRIGQVGNQFRYEISNDPLPGFRPVTAAYASEDPLPPALGNA